MAEPKVERNTDSRDWTTCSSADEFTDFLELQATRMELYGYMGEAGNMRKWATELRLKSVESCHITGGNDAEP